MITEAPYHTQQGVENFQTWFGQSVVVDASKQPLRVYHGCAYPAGFNDKPVFTNKFKSDVGNDWGDAVLGHFFTASPEVANAFSSEDGATIPAYLSIQDPDIYTGARFFRLLNSDHTNWKQLRKRTIAAGYDGIIVEADPSIAKSDRGWIQFDATTYIVFNSNQIKSAIGNNGKFNPKKNSFIEGTVVKSFKQFVAESNDVPPYFKSDEAFRKYWQSRGVDNTTYIGRDYIRPMDIVINKKERNQGLGTEFMEDLCRFADYHKLPIRLSPSTDFGATSKARLVSFYKRFGFVENKGKNKNYKFNETMYRRANEII